MAIDYQQFLGRRYREPFGCFELVRCILHEQGVKIPNYAEKVTESEKAAALRDLIVIHCFEVEQPREGDVVLLRWGGRPAHVGMMIDGSDFIHSLEGNGAHIESTNDTRWRNRIDGFWRLRD